MNTYRDPGLSAELRILAKALESGRDPDVVAEEEALARLDQLEEWANWDDADMRRTMTRLIAYIKERVRATSSSPCALEAERPENYTLRLTAVITPLLLGQRSKR